MGCILADCLPSAKDFRGNCQVMKLEGKSAVGLALDKSQLP